jgi:hypothetical protein
MNKKFLLGALCSTLIAGGAVAQVDPQVSYSVKPVPAAVTISATQNTPTTYLAYIIKFVNDGGSDLGTLHIDGTLATTDPRLMGAEILSALLPTECTPDATAPLTKVRCSYVDVSPRTAFDIPIIVKAPKFSGAAGELVEGSVTFDTVAVYREGKSLAQPTTNSSWATFDFPLVSTSVNGVNPVRLDSVVIKSGGQFYTGERGIPTSTPGDQHASLVDFQEWLMERNYAELYIQETFVSALTDPACIGANSFKNRCWITEIFAPDVKYTGGKYLTATIREHVSNIKGSAGQISWYYVYKDGAGVPQTYPIQLCGSVTQPDAGGATPNGLPCQQSRVQCYRSGALADICEWKFNNTGNGLIKGYF